MPVRHAKKTAKRQMLDKTNGILIVRVSIRNPELTSRHVRGLGLGGFISEREPDTGR